MIIVSAVIIAIGLAMGLIFQFVSNGYFNQGADYASYNCVVVDYAFIDGQADTVKDVCEKAFDDAGVKYYACVGGETNEGGKLIYKFTKSTDKDKVIKAKDAISGKLAGEDEFSLSTATFHEVEGLFGNAKALSFGAIALASAIAFQLIYVAIRYRQNAVFSVLLADVHNLAIFVSLLAITRTPVGSSVFAFATLTVVLTMIGCCFLFDNLRKGAKDEKFANLSSFEQVDASANASLVSILVVSLAVAASAVVLFALMAVSALSVNLILTAALSSLLAAASSIYGTAFFTPAVHSRIKLLGDNFKASHDKKAKK